MLECCKKMEQKIEEETIATLDQADGEKHYYIHGKPAWVNDGDGYFDDNTSEIEINYCPFCGKKLHR